MAGDALTINSLGDLQIALLEDDNTAIGNYIERLDRETSNEAFKKCGEQFDFPVVEVEGVFRTSGNHLSRVFGYKNVNGLTQLLERRGIWGINIGGFTRDVQIKITETLGLSPQDRKSILYDWPAFLIGGMNSQNEEAKMVQAYLLRMEKIARVGVVATREAMLNRKHPDAATGAVLCNLAKEAWRGNPIAANILEAKYDIPAARLLELAEPEISETTEIVAKYLSLLTADRHEAAGLCISKTPRGWRVSGRTEAFYRAFLDIARAHNLRHFFRSTINLGAVMGQEALALELLGWRRRVSKIRGYYHYTYEYEAPEFRETALGFEQSCLSSDSAPPA